MDTTELEKILRDEHLRLQTQKTQLEHALWATEGALALSESLIEKVSTVPSVPLPEESK